MNMLFIANYKMNGDKNFFKKVNKVFNKLKSEDTIVLCPPFLYMPFLKIKNKNVFLGAQNIAAQENDKSTGEISAKMLTEVNCKYCLVGHSERRAIGETNEEVAAKVLNAQKHNIIPVVCVGEEGQRSDLLLLEEQVKSALTKAEDKQVVFAYEPIWAIGTGETPTVANIKKAVKIIKITAKHCGFNVKVLYGGSVNDLNYKELLKSNVNGFLMGGISLKLDKFINIVKGE